MRMLVFIIAVALVACGGKRTAPTISNASSTSAASDDAPATEDEVPADVASLIERWELCHHWAGEEPYDAARAAEIQAGVAASCPGNDETLARLETRYADRPEILLRLHALPE